MGIFLFFEKTRNFHLGQYSLFAIGIMCEVML